MLQYNGKRTSAVAETEVLGAADVGVFSAKNRVVVGISQRDEVMVTNVVDWELGRENRSEAGSRLGCPRLAETRSRLGKSFVDRLGSVRRRDVVVNVEVPIVGEDGVVIEAPIGIVDGVLESAEFTLPGLRLSIIAKERRASCGEIVDEVNELESGGWIGEFISEVLQ